MYIALDLSRTPFHLSREILTQTGQKGARIAFEIVKKAFGVIRDP
jgi:hypothetical protein